MPVIQAQPKKDYQAPQLGLQPSRIIRIIDLGTQEVSFQGQPSKPKRQISFTWELPMDLMADNRPLVISKRINLTIGDKATLTKLIKACTAKEPKVGDDPLKLIGATCNLTIGKYLTEEGKEGVGIEGFAPLMKGQVVPDAANPYVVFDLDKFDKGIFDGLSDYNKEAIMKSPEYQEIANPSSAIPAAVHQDDELNDEIPF